MTAYEASELFLGFLNTYFQFMLGYVSILSAFLIMVFAARDKIGRFLSILVLGLFSLVCLMLIIQINLLRNDFTQLNLFLFELKESNPAALAWFGTNPSWLVNMLTRITNIVLFGGYAGCIAYFLYQQQASSEDGESNE